MRHPEKPYRPPLVPAAASERRPFLAILWLGAIIGSILLVLFGISVAGLGMLPSDAPGVFQLCGAHLIACGALGVLCALTKWRDTPLQLFCWMSMFLNSALMVVIAILISIGTVRGPLIVAAPLLIGLPALINVEESAFLRLLLVMLVSAVAFLAETLLRRLAISHVIAGALAIAFTGGFYFLLLFGLAAGGV